MKKNLIYAAFAACGALLLGSCAQELDNVTPNVDADGLMTITASFPEDVESKVTFSETYEGLDLAWDKDDYLTVVSGSVREKYTIDSFDGKVAKFKGKPVSGTSFDVILSRSGDYVSRTYTGQTQTTVTSKDHLLYDAVLKGVGSYENVKFTPEWAQANGGTFAENGCMLIRFKMPEDAGYLKTVTLTAPEAVFYTTNAADGEKTASMTLALSDADMAADNVVEAYVMTSMQEASVSGELTLTVVSNLGTWSKEFNPGAFTLKTGKRNVITLNDENWTTPRGNGTEASPYIIRTTADLEAMANKVTKETKTYFAMVNDIDMSSITEWISISEQLIDFNGNNRILSNFKCSTGSYRGFVRILNGRIANVTFVNADVAGDASDGNQPCGIVCGYCGNGAATCYGEIENVHVQGVVTGNGGGVGGVAGVIGHGKINRCSADIQITNKNQRTGGIAGYHKDANAASICEVTNCFSKGTIVSNNQKASGVISDLHGDAKSTNIDKVQYCYSTVDVTATRNVAGIVANAWNSNTYSAVEYCIAWNPNLKTTSTTTAGANFVSGAIVGSSRNKQTLTDCVRRSDMNLNCKVTTDTETFNITLMDHNNADSTNRLPYSGPADTAYDYLYPYHGKAAAAGETVSDVAKRLGWDETIWDLSGDYPQLIK